ncbi:MAG: polyprenyl synthetase family protein [Pirellulales bacterium]|nr:polyprenyl synthetase family protein [Pirellulales bacterium]
MTETLQDLLVHYTERVRPRVDRALEAALPRGDGCPRRLREAMHYGLLAPGKRLRPMLVLMAAEACEGSSAQAMPAACAVEMVHAYSLIHDDLPAMDDDDLRRGRPTCHKVFGEAMAILAGDALLTLAFQTLAAMDAPAAVVASCCAALAEAAGAEQLVGGQADDVDGPRPGADLAVLEAIHRRKTGSLFGVSLRLGALVAKAKPSQHAALARYSRAVGLAFQIVDDLLDVEGAGEVLGKRVGKDVDHGKLTFPGVLGIDASRARARRLVDEARAALADFGPGTAPLEALAGFVLERNR